MKSVSLVSIQYSVILQNFGCVLRVCAPAYRLQMEWNVLRTVNYGTFRDKLLDKYRGADKSLARPGRKHATATKL